MINKKINFIIIILLFLFNFQLKTNALEYKCTYVSDKHDYKLEITMDSEKKTMSSVINEIDCTFCREYEQNHINIADNLLTSDEEMLQDIITNIYSGFCDTTLLMVRYWSDGAQTHYFRILFNDSLEAEAKEYFDGSLAKGTYIDTSFEWLEFKQGESTAPGKNIGYKCKKYDNIYDSLELAYSNISTCEKGCSKYYQQKSKLIDQIREYCNVQMSHLTYGNSCLNKCLTVSNDIENLENKYNIIDNDEQKCGFSGRLILFVGNIIKWCKYIVPVIAIVLSILDFIKAIGAGKEDEMKKAQGKFIKRLIVAGLVFIMPFIIEFILNKMGFEANGCGIIDL